MEVRLRRHPKEEFARRGLEIFERDVDLGLGLADEGKYVAIDIETGAWEMDADEMTAGDRLRERVPDAQMWLERVGYGYVHRFGFRIDRCSRSGRSAEARNNHLPQAPNALNYRNHSEARKLRPRSR